MTCKMRLLIRLGRVLMSVFGVKYPSSAQLGVAIE